MKNIIACRINEIKKTEAPLSIRMGTVKITPSSTKDAKQRSGFCNGLPTVSISKWAKYKAKCRAGRKTTEQQTIILSVLCKHFSKGQRLSHFQQLRSVQRTGGKVTISKRVQNNQWPSLKFFSWNFCSRKAHESIASHFHLTTW